MNPKVLGGGILAYAVGTAVFYSYNRRKRDLKFEHDGNAFASLAKTYDERINVEEHKNGYDKLRKEYLKDVKGKVLEIAAGTGRNISVYNSNEKIESVVLSDVCDKMLEQSAKKIQNAKVPIKTAVCDAAKLPFSNESFDSVVDTFGLCSISEPEKAMEEMKRVLKTDGRIVLLEHGRSYKYRLLSRYIDWVAPRHYRVWGCHHNKDIKKIISDCDLKIESEKTFDYGTTYYYKLKK